MDQCIVTRAPSGARKSSSGLVCGWAAGPSVSRAGRTPVKAVTVSGSRSQHLPLWPLGRGGGPHPKSRLMEPCAKQQEMRAFITYTGASLQHVRNGLREQRRVTGSAFSLSRGVPREGGRDSCHLKFVPVPEEVEPGFLSAFTDGAWKAPSLAPREPSNTEKWNLTLGSPPGFYSF